MWQTFDPSLVRSKGGGFFMCLEVARNGQKDATCHLALSDWHSRPKER